MSLIAFIVLGALAGWLAGKIMKGSGSGLIVNIFIGIVGSMIGGWVFNFFGFNSDGGFIGSLITATVGAIILIFVVSKLKK